MLILLLLFLSIFVHAQSVEDELLLQFRTAEGIKKCQTLKSGNLEMEAVIPEWNLYRIKSKGKSINELKNLLKKDPEVLQLQENHILKLRSRPNDPKYDQWQWNMELLGLPEAWTFSSGGVTALGDSIVVAVIDGGCDLQHEDLSANIWYNWHEIPGDSIDNDQNGYTDDFRGWQPVNENDIHDPNSHGTSVSGIIGASGNNGIGISGINWNVKLMQVSAAEQELLLESNLLKAYAYVLKQRRLYRESGGQKGAFVVAVNLSAGVDYGKAEDFPLWCAVYDSLGKEGILSVGSVMNNDVNVDSDGDMPTVCPSPFLIAVTNSTRFDAMDLNAAYGPKNVDIAAPGAVYTLRPNNSYNTFGGTSGAAPHVTGAIALMASYPHAEWAFRLKNEPESAALLLRDIILSSAEKFSSFEGKTISGGRLQVGKAMKMLQKLYSEPEIPITVLSWTYSQLLLKFDIETPGDYVWEIFDVMGRLRERKQFSVAAAGQYSEFLDLLPVKNEVLLLRLSHKNGKRIGTLKF